MLISPAYAQTGGGAGFDIMALAPLVLIFVVFYFLLIRPQQKKLKQHRDMLTALRRGDRVVVGGIIGSIAKVVSDTELSVEIAEGVRVRVVRSAVTDVVAKTEPVKSDGGKSDPAEDKAASGS
jgi:preprotein translocase subunit YajC